MLRFACLLFLCVAGLTARSQGIEWLDREDTYRVGLGQHARIPIRIRNSSDRPQTYIIRKAAADLNDNQKGYFCMGDECFDVLTEQITRRLEAGEIVTNLFFVVETGLSATSNSFRFEAFPKGSPQMNVEHAFLLSIEEKPIKSFVYQSRDITVHDVYPNPVTNQQAFIDYRLTDEAVKAKVVIHNILGSPVGEYDLPAFETRVKIQSEDLASGVYFYTVYLDNIGVLTRKLVVRK